MIRVGWDSHSSSMLVSLSICLCVYDQALMMKTSKTEAYVHGMVQENVRSQDLQFHVLILYAVHLGPYSSPVDCHRL